MRDCKEGDRSKLVCHQCEAARECEYSYGPLEFKGETVDDVLRAVCLTCAGVVAIHSRSTYRLAEVSARQAQRRTTITIPVEMQDYIAHHLIQAGSNWSHSELYFRALLVACHENPEEIGKLVAVADDELLRRPNKARLNFSLGGQLSSTLARISKASGISNTSEIIRRLVVLTKDSIKEPFERELMALALAYA